MNLEPSVSYFLLGEASQVAWVSRPPLNSAELQKNSQDSHSVHGGTVGKESTCQCRHMGYAGLIPGSGRSSKEGNSNLLQYSCLENSMDRGAWQATVNGVVRSQTQLSDFHFSRVLALILVLPLQYSCLENSIRQRSLVGYSPCCHKEWNMNKQ